MVCLSTGKSTNLLSADFMSLYVCVCVCACSEVNKHFEKCSNLFGLVGLLQIEMTLIGKGLCVMSRECFC